MLVFVGDYRNDRGALREANADLEDELAAREQQLAEREAELARKRDELAAKDAELAELRKRVAPEPAPVAAPGICTACGKANQLHYKFCLGCGADMPEVASHGAKPALQITVEPLTTTPDRRVVTALLTVICIAVLIAVAFASMH